MAPLWDLIVSFENECIKTVTKTGWTVYFGSLRQMYISLFIWLADGRGTAQAAYVKSDKTLSWGKNGILLGHGN